MKTIVKVIFFLVILTILDFIFRKGFGSIPLPIPSNISIITLFSLFALASLLITKYFGKSDNLSLKDLGISFSSKNCLEFLWGLIIGIVLWAIVSIFQSYIAGFSWELRPHFSTYNIFYGLFFIFIADLGTELYTRGYPLTKLKNSLGANVAIIIMVFFVALKSFSFNLGGELLFYSILIPALHTVFFSIIYLKTKRLGASLGLHTGANFVTISIFDLRATQPGQTIPSGIFQADTDLEMLSLSALQLPWVLMAIFLSIGTYYWWKRKVNISDKLI